jgi:hypothetical protein
MYKYLVVFCYAVGKSRRGERRFALDYREFKTKAEALACYEKRKADEKTNYVYIAEIKGRFDGDLRGFPESANKINDPDFFSEE